MDHSVSLDEGEEEREVADDVGVDGEVEVG